MVRLGVDVGESVLHSTSTYHDLGGQPQENDLALRWDEDHLVVTALGGGPWTPTTTP